MSKKRLEQYCIWPSWNDDCELIKAGSPEEALQNFLEESASLTLKPTDYFTVFKVVKPERFSAEPAKPVARYEIKKLPNSKA